MRLIILGGGNMGGSILHSIENIKDISPKNILLIEKDERKRNNLSKASGCLSQRVINQNISGYDYILIAIKPQGAIAVLELLSRWLLPHQIIISIMAGISINTMSEKLRQNKIVRVMPNVPTMISEGMSIFFSSDSVDKKERDVIQTLFSACGSCIEAKNEDAIDAATAISGSGPGYFFYFAEKITESAISLGFSESDANLLVQKTIRGSALLWESQGIPPKVLKDRVSSPGGTTLAALDHFNSEKVGKSIKEGIKKAYERAKELSS